MRMIFDRWHTKTGGYMEVEVKNFSMVEDFIIRLDQSEFTEVIIESDNGILTIAGGNEDYVASIQKKGVYYDLMQSEQLPKSKQIEMMVGGKSTFYNSSRVVSVNEVLIAVQSFYENGDRDTTFHWEKRTE